MAHWTPEQQQAIDARECNLLVAAAAGSGKTAVLVERIIQLIIKDGVDIDRMLIVTFTNAAAGEMRERIGSALLTAIEERRGSSEHLRQQLGLLSRASISTLHAFCIGVLRKYFHLIDLDPGFRIGDETETHLLKLEVMEELLESEYEKGDECFLGLVERFGGTRQDTPLQDLILKVHGFIQSKPDPIEWLSERVEDFRAADPDAAGLPWAQAISAQLRMELTGALSLIEEALVLCRQSDGPAAYEAAFLDDSHHLLATLEALNQGLSACSQSYTGYYPTALKRCSNAVDERLKGRAKNLRDQVKKILQGLEDGFFQRDLADYMEDLHALHPYMAILCRLVKDFDDAFKEQKQERGILDFNDLEHYTLQLLKREEAAAELKERYVYIFVDEYQDSNIVQETILNRICRENNRFMVGDVKQSIYRFRLADPSLFIRKYYSFENREGARDRRIDLNRNFRSRAEVLSGVNAIFRSVMSEAFGEIPYDDQAALYPGLDLPPLPQTAIEVHLVDKVVENAALDAEIEDLTHMEVEAHVTAQSIHELMHTEIYDAKLGAFRGVEYRDIVILMRSTRGCAPIFQEVLAAQGIPVYADVNNGYFDALEVKTFIDLLKIIDNKCQDIPLLGVLRSPIGGFEADDLIAIRTSSSARTFHEAAAQYCNQQTDILQQRLTGFYSQLASWQQAARYLTMEDFLWRLFTETGYYTYVGAMPGGKQRQANLRILLDRAIQFQNTSIRGLFQFIRFIDKLKSSSGDMGTAKILGENENVLRIMSIHKSKGLEFPVVIVAGLGRQFNQMDTNESVLLHKDLGIGPRYVDPDTRQRCDTIAKAAMKGVIRLESLAEEMRILYVAMTRPKDRLILLGSIRDLSKAAENWSRRLNPYQLSRGKCCMDWIGPVLMHHRDGAVLRALVEGEWEEGLPITADASEWLVKLHSRSELTSRHLAETKEQESLRLKLIHCPEGSGEGWDQLIAERFSWRYPHQTAVGIPSKLTVTEVKRLQSAGKSDTKTPGYQALMGYPSALMERPRFMEGTRQFTAAEKGTIMHFALQHMDLKRLSTMEEIHLQIEELSARELLTEEEAGVVDVEAIRQFYASPIGCRIQKAGQVLREVPFNYRKEAREVMPGLEDCPENLLIQGVIDCCFEEEGQWVLVDYKTDYAYSEASVNAIVEQYRIQLTLYSEALERITGKPVKERILYLLSIGQACKI